MHICWIAWLQLPSRQWQPVFKLLAKVARPGCPPRVGPLLINAEAWNQRTGISIQEFWFSSLTATLRLDRARSLTVHFSSPPFISADFTTCISNFLSSAFAPAQPLLLLLYFPPHSLFPVGISGPTFSPLPLLCFILPPLPFR